MLRSKKWLIGILAAVLLICAALSLAFLPGPATRAEAEPLPEDVTVEDIADIVSVTYNDNDGVTTNSTYAEIKDALTVTVTLEDDET